MLQSKYKSKAPDCKQSGAFLRVAVAARSVAKGDEFLAWRYGLKGDGLPQREVADKLGISRSYVSRIEKKALAKLKERFEMGG